MALDKLRAWGERENYRACFDRVFGVLREYSENNIVTLCEGLVFEVFRAARVWGMN